MKKCIINGCEEQADIGRRYCHKHFLERKAEQRKVRKESGLTVRTMYEHKCKVCNESFLSGNKHKARFCKKCWQKISTTGSHTNNQYTYVQNGYRDYQWEHRRQAEITLDRKLNSNEVVHHLDENPNNNELINLIVLSRNTHTALHRYLNTQRAIIEESMIGNNENCWDNLRVPMTTAWLETTSAKVIKL